MSGHQAGVVAGAAGDDLHGANLLEECRGCLAEGLRQHMGAGYPALQGVGEGAWLFEDLFLHVMAVFASLDGIGVERGFPHRAAHRLTLPVKDVDLLPADGRDVALFKEDKALGDGQEGEDVRGNEVLAKPQADDQGTALAGGHQQVGVPAVDHAKGIGALQGFDRCPNGLQEGPTCLELVMNSMDDNLRVGFR